MVARIRALDLTITAMSAVNGFIGKRQGVGFWRKVGAHGSQPVGFLGDETILRDR